MTARVTAIMGPARCGKTTRMLERYRRALVEQPPESTLWLAPTWRAAASIRDRLLTSHLRGCFSPSVMTFDRFAEAVLEASPVPVRPLNRLGKRQLVRRLLDDELAAGRLRHFGPIARTGGLVDLICDFIRELKRLDVWPDRFRQACHARGMTDKDTEVLAVYEAYQRCLTEHALYDAEGRFWSARSQLREGRRGPFERLQLVVVDGFSDFTPPEHEILKILAGWVEELLITLALEPGPRRTDLFGKPLGTLAELRRRHPGLVDEQLARPPQPDWPVMAHLEAGLFDNPRHARPAADTSGAEILAASQQLGEIELIGAYIKRLLVAGDAHSGGRPVRPGDVAVVFRSPADADPLVREVFGKLGIPFALESGQSLDRSTALAALVGLVRLDVDDWPFRDLLAVLAGNYFQPDWPECHDGKAAVAAERAIRALQIPRGRERLLDALQRRAGQTAPEDPDGQSSRENPQKQAALARSLLGRLQEVFGELPERATLAGWAIAWQKLAEQTGLLKAIEQAKPSAPDHAETARPARVPTSIADDVAWDRLQDALKSADALARWLGRTPPELDRREALDALLDTLRSVGVHHGADESGRVRVLSATSVRALEVPYLFFAGLAEKSFPPPDRQDRLYSEAEYQGLIRQGLPLVARTERNREEMLLFYEVMTRATRRLYFSYPALDEAAQPLSPSPYLEEVEQACGPGRIPRTEVPDLSPVPTHDEPLSAGEFRVKAVATALEGDGSLLAGLIRLEPAAGLAESVLAGLRITDQRRDRNRFGPTEGILQSSAACEQLAARFGPQRTFRATELEQYASCPYRFFAERVLGLEPPVELALAVDYLKRGRLVHDALAALHQRINRAHGGPTSPAALEQAEYDRLADEALEEVFPRGSTNPLDDALREVDRRLWLRWAADYRRQHERYDELWKRCAGPLLPAYFEVSFGRGRGVDPLSTDRPLEISGLGEPIRIAGRIDRIDTGSVAGQTVFNVLDYKTGSSARLSLETVARGTALQLPLYVMATEQLLLAPQRAVAWQAGYWYLRKNGFTPRQALKMHASEGEGLKPEPEWQQLRRTVVEVVGALVESIRGGQFAVSSADEHCTRFCPLRTICRINQIRSLEKTWQPLLEEA